MRLLETEIIVHVEKNWFDVVVYKTNKKSIVSSGIEFVPERTHHNGHRHK